MKFTFKLPKAVKTKWVKALRSGKYKQGRGLLCQKINGEESFCCLGVARREGLCKGQEGARANVAVRRSFLPTDVQNFLAYKNDGREWSFKRIATWIEKNL